MTHAEIQLLGQTENNFAFQICSAYLYIIWISMQLKIGTLRYSAHMVVAYCIMGNYDIACTLVCTSSLKTWPNKPEVDIDYGVFIEPWEHENITWCQKN